MKVIKDSIENFFKWVSNSELVELTDIDCSEDPVRPELDLEFRTSFGRKIFGLKANNEIQGIICVAYCNDIPQRWNDLGVSMITLFQVLTLSSWEQVMLPLQEIYWWAWIYFFSFIII